MSFVPTAATPGGYDYQQFIGDQPSPTDASSTSRVVVDETLIPQNSAPSSHERNDVPLAQDQAAHAVPPKTSGIVNAPALDIPQEAILERDVKHIPKPEDKAMYPLQGQETARSTAIPTSSSAGPTRQTGFNSATATEKQVYGTTVNSRDNKVDENSPSVQSGKAEAGRDPKADFILVFSLPSREASSQEWSSAEQEYGHLKNVLSGAGFQVAARPGGKDRNERLMIIKAKINIIRAEAQSEK